MTRLLLVLGLVGLVGSSDVPTPAPAPLALADTTVEAGAAVFDYIGVYHATEAPAADGERWLGLYATDSGWELVPVTVHTRTAYDPIEDDEAGPFTGVEVRTDRSTRTGDVLSDDGLAFFKSDRLTAGPVHTAFAGFWQARPATELYLWNALHSASLAAESVPGQPGETVLKLAGAPILHHTNRDDGTLALHWAGDLDRDGRLDLVLDASPHYNMTRLQLWLSSAAVESAPLGLAAEHQTTGC